MQQHAAVMEASFKRDASLRPARRPRGRPMHPMLVSFSAACFTGALLTDLVYWQMPDVMWERFSIWVIPAGLIMACLAAIAYVIELAGGWRIDRPAWPRAIGYAIAVLLSLTN